jgi:putative FmdB family regulatory protein
MPLYEYRCHQCGATFEKLQRFSDAPLSQHENCGGKVERLISAPGLQFKGSGWYITDYARKNGSSPTSSKTDTPAPAAKPDAPKSGSDSKS